VEVRPAWIVTSALVFFLGIASTFLLTRTKRSYGAQVITLLVLMYALILLLLWGTTSTYFFTQRIELPATLKRLLLAGAGGLLAQIGIWLNRLARGKDKHHHIAPMYFDAVMGTLSGLAAAAFLATYRATFTAISDQQAAVAGVAGGALGLSLFDVLKTRFLPRIDGEPATVSATPAQHGECLYAGQAYSHGSNVVMPAPGGGTVVKTCDGKARRWDVKARDA